MTEVENNCDIDSILECIKPKHPTLAWKKTVTVTETILTEILTVVGCYSKVADAYGGYDRGQ